MSESGPVAAPEEAGKPSGPARRSRERLSPRRHRLRRFLLWVALPSVAVYLGVCALVLASLDLMTSEINRIDADRAEKAVNAMVDTFLTQLGETAGDEATWTEAYINTYVSLNPAWVDSTWGTTARDDGAYDTAIVADVTGVVLFGESVKGPLSGKISDHFSATAQMIDKLNAAVLERGDGAVVANFSATGNEVAALAAAVIHGTSGQVSVPKADRRVLWLAKRLDPELLQQSADRFQTPLPHLGKQLRPNEASVALVDAAGSPLGLLGWTPRRPGDAAFAHAAGVAAVVLLIIAVLCFAVLAGFYQSVARRAESEEREWVGARYDDETGLLNRFGLEEALAKVLRRRAATPVALCIVELDGLKNIIGNYGDAACAELVDVLANGIEGAISHGVLLARVATDQFALAATGDTATAQVSLSADAVLHILVEPIQRASLKVKLTASIGLASLEGGDLDRIFGMANAALQQARETGGNQLVRYEPSIEAAREARLAMQADIRRGLEADEFDLDYQPIVDFDAEAISGVEALLRWRRRPGGPVSPGDFIPAAEASGQIEDLGLFALRRACAEIGPYPHLKLSVNVSTVQFRSAALASQIDAILAATGFPPTRLQLEITESFLLTQPERASAVIDDLRSRGIAIALDDFGTGYSSAGYLRQFRFDRVKLDRSLVADMDKDQVKAALVESTMLFAFAMGLAVTAEGVERHEEARALTRMGCREFQGFLLSQPLTLDGLGRLLRQRAEPQLKAG